MFEQAGDLLTFATDEIPRCGESVSAERLANHRLMYLDYEGEVSDDRGAVTQWDYGNYDGTWETSQRWVAALRGQSLGGKVTIDQQGDAWTLTFTDA